MKRRMMSTPVPQERLVRFVPSEWPGAPLEAFNAWRAESLKAATDDPRGPLGSPVEVICRARQTRLRHWRLFYGVDRYTQHTERGENL